MYTTIDVVWCAVSLPLAMHTGMSPQTTGPNSNEFQPKRAIFRRLYDSSVNNLRNRRGLEMSFIPCYPFMAQNINDVTWYNQYHMAKHE
jgi:hypothetical protein